ncbi:MAG: hypothetical protein J5537_11355 [Lachnospiraceae bacterium]|nr:hypothetical protein [Lachnospiraceae bacterium]
MEWQWEEGSYLYGKLPHYDTKKTFDAVCREIQRFYQGKDSIKALKRKIRWTGKNIILEIAFGTSHSNLREQFVGFEIISCTWAIDKSDMNRNGYLPFKHWSDFHYKKNFNVVKMNPFLFSDLIAAIEERISFAKYMDTPEGFIEHINDYPMTPRYRVTDEPNVKVHYERMKKLLEAEKE